ncbi:tyrosine-type recombinase/integrase [Massilia sp. TN1-12]|uniref:tyrosine-type recombinase/integrase n=1 Tax=Massilia paldalensis TaxID=3377675 RepID=UPI00384E8C26
MGRKPSKNLNLPPHMRKRTQRSGRTFYYLDTGEKPRREIPLGDDYIAALRKYAEIHQIEKVAAPKFGDVILKYEAEVMPTLAISTQRTHASDMKHLRASFQDAPLDQIKPMHIQKLLDKHKDKPTTANRCKRLFSALWNKARGWGYTDEENPCIGIEGHSLKKRDVYVTDEVFDAVRAHASEPLREALEFAYLTGQRPGDALKARVDDIKDGVLYVSQGKTGKKLGIAVVGQLAELVGRIQVRKAAHKTVHGQILMVRDGQPMTKQILRDHFAKAKELAAAKHPDLAGAIKEFWFYDLRAKAADDTSTERGEQAASDLLGHDSVKTTRKHYLRRGKIVVPVK